MDNFIIDDFITGPQADEVNEFDLDLEEPDDEEYYEDGSELFMEDMSNIEGTIDDILEDLDLDESKEKELYDKLIEAKKNSEIMEELKSACIDKICDSDTICNYISDYSISELGDMDGIWNTFGDILRDTICEYFSFNEEGDC